MKTVIYSCPFIPAEWIAAHGLEPMRVMPAGSPPAGQGICPYTQAFLHLAADHDGAVLFTTVCDQMRRGAEWLERSGGPPVFLMHVPTTWQSPGAHKLYAGELKRLGRFLETLGGSPPDDTRLAEVMLDYDSKRARLRAALGRLSGKRFSETMAEFHRSGTLTMPMDDDGPARGAMPIALVGGPLRPHLFELFDIIRRWGGEVVLDATTTGERTLPSPFDRRRVGEDPFTALAEAYFSEIPDAFRRPNSRLYQWLKQELEARNVAGILFLRYTWCDTWSGEMQRMKEGCGRPLLGVDTGDESAIEARTVSRIESFLEMLMS